MQTQNIDIHLHDIKPILEIKEYSFYYFLGCSLLLVVLFIGITYLIYKYIKNKNRFNIKKHHLKLLEAIDTTNPKKAAYDITLYGATFKDESPRHEQMYSNLISRLEEFKYKKQVEPLSDEALSYFELYKEMCHV